jgi:hypothetical protein
MARHAFAREKSETYIECDQCGYKGDSEECIKCGERHCPMCGFRETLISQKLVIGPDGYKLPCPEHTRYHFGRWCATCYLNHHTKTTVMQVTQDGPVVSRPYPDPVQVYGMQEPLSKEGLAIFDARLWQRNMPFVEG